MSATLLDINNASRAFADRQALRGVDLTVGRGEIIALLGPNGAGKTTLMRAIAGRLRLDDGRVSVQGLDPLHDGAARRALGVVPQTIALYPQLSGRQNLDVLARLSGLKGRAVHTAVTKALACVLLEDRADERLSALSGGMQRRLNIVAGTLHSPQLLLLDEPTVGLDLQARESIHELLRTLRDSGIGILFSTHDFDQAAEVADRAVFMDRGRVLLEGRVDQLIAEYFGDSKEALVELAQPATSAALSVLEEYGLSGAPDDKLWSGPLAGGYAELARLEARMEDAGAHVAEMRVREPSLGGVFMQLMAAVPPE